MTCPRSIFWEIKEVPSRHWSTCRSYWGEIRYEKSSQNESWVIISFTSKTQTCVRKRFPIDTSSKMMPNVWWIGLGERSLTKIKLISSIIRENTSDNVIEQSDYERWLIHEYRTSHSRYEKKSKLFFFLICHTSSRTCIRLLTSHWYFAFLWYENRWHSVRCKRSS